MYWAGFYALGAGRPDTYPGFCNDIQIILSSLWNETLIHYKLAPIVEPGTHL